MPLNGGSPLSQSIIPYLGDNNILYVQWVNTTLGGGEDFWLIGGGDGVDEAGDFGGLMTAIKTYIEGSPGYEANSLEIISYAETSTNIVSDF
jgi:hypothetical protein